MIGLMIGVLAVAIVGVGVVVPIVNSSELVMTDKTISLFLNIVPIFIGLGLIAPIILFIGGSGSSDDEEEDPVAPEELPDKHDYKKERLWAEEILKRRYARGEISTVEYNERMSNL